MQYSIVLFKLIVSTNKYQMSDYLSLENRLVSIHGILIPDLPAKIEYLFGTINPCYKCIICVHSDLVVKAIELIGFKEFYFNQNSFVCVSKC